MSLTALLAHLEYYSPLLLTPTPLPQSWQLVIGSTTSNKTVETIPSIFYILSHTNISSKQKKKAPSTSPIQRCFGLKPNVYNSRVILSNTGYEERGCFSTGFVRGCSIGWTLINSNVSCILKGIQGNTFQPEYISTNTLFNLHLNWK